MKHDTSVINDPEMRFSRMKLPVFYIDGREWEMAADISYVMRDGRVSTVRKGFCFDFASIPRILWRIFPPTGDGSPYGIAATWHDWLYVHKRIGGKTINKGTADALFLEIMLYTGVPRWKAELFFRMVKWFGGHAWRT